MDHPTKTCIIPPITRREFLEGTGKAALVLTAIGAEGTPKESRPDALAEAFRTPPDWAQPWVYWWWLNGYVTRDGLGVSKGTRIPRSSASNSAACQ